MKAAFIADAGQVILHCVSHVDNPTMSKMCRVLPCSWSDAKGRPEGSTGPPGSTTLGFFKGRSDMAFVACGALSKLIFPSMKATTDELAKTRLGMAQTAVASAVFRP